MNEIKYNISISATMHDNSKVFIQVENVGIQVVQDYSIHHQFNPDLHKDHSISILERNAFHEVEL